MIRNTIMTVFGLGLAGLGIQLARSLTRWHVGASSVWSSRVDALELGFVMGLFGIVLWSLVRTKLKDALDRTRLEDAPYVLDDHAISGASDRLAQPEMRLDQGEMTAEHAMGSRGRCELAEATIAFDLRDEVAG
jgi:hypothetical protein